MSESEAVAFQPLKLECFTLEAWGLIVKGEPAVEEWQGIGELLATMDHGSPWLIGDWYNMGLEACGEEFAQALDGRKLSESTCRTYAWVCKKVPQDGRFQELSFSHHQVVAECEVAQQQKWLKAAIKGDWSVARLKQEMRAEEDGAPGKLRYFVIVECKDEQDQQALYSEMIAAGRTCKLNISGKPKDKKEAKEGVTAKRKRRAPMNATRRKPS